MIIPVYQPFAASSHQIAKTFRNSHANQNKEPTTHTGTLDPMAEGVLILLTGEDRFQKDAFSKWKKTYEWSIVWGLKTDSDDRLGLLTKKPEFISENNINEINIKEKIKHFIGVQQQKIHPFSARRISGKSSFDFAKEQQFIQPIFRMIEIIEFDFLRTEQILLTNEIEKWIKIIEQIHGNFRQEQIIQQWKQLQNNPKISEQPFYETHFLTKCSSGTYIRQIAHDLAESLQVCGVVSKICRTQNGEFKINDCININRDLMI